MLGLKLKRMMPLTQCSNCEQLTQKISFGIRDSKVSFIPTSDGNYLDHVKVERFFCEVCACFQVETHPKNRLQNFFMSEYNLSDQVQNNWVIRDEQKVSKHALLSQQIFSLLDSLDKKAAILEIACGNGTLISSIQRSYPQFDFHAIDPALPMNLDFTQIQFHRGFFSDIEFSESRFDLVIAHGLLNRCATLPNLRKISRLLKPGGIVSIEILLLEFSDFAPLIWDHQSYFTRAIFEDYLIAAGLELINFSDNVSSVQFLCRNKSQKQLPFIAERSKICSSLDLFRKQILLWESRAIRIRTLADASNSGFGLFGAGLYTAALLSLIGPSKIKFIVDEFKAGSSMLGIPVIALKSVATFDYDKILLCVRPAYLTHIQRCLSRFNLSGDEI